MALNFTPEEIAYETEDYQDNKSPAITAGSVVLIGTATITVILRLLSRKIKTREARRTTLGTDDYIIIVALLLAYGMFVAMLYCAHYGFGKHILRVGLPDAVKAGKALYVLEAIYPATTTATKISILLLYRRIFTTLNPFFKYAMYIISTVLVGWAISGFFTTVFQCMPVHFAWDHMGDSCIDLVPALLGLAIINTVVNAAVLVLPMPMVWYLNMPRRRKIAVCGIFLIGSGDVVSSVVRTYLTSQLKTTDVDFTFFRQFEIFLIASSPTYVTKGLETDAAILALVEPCLGIICACLPVMRPLFGSISNSFFSYKESRKSSQGSTSRHISSPNPQSDVFPLQSRPENYWIELGKRNSRGAVNECRRYKMESGTEIEHVESTGEGPPRSDLESLTPSE